MWGTAFNLIFEKLQGSMHRCNGRADKTEMMLLTVFNSLPNVKILDVIKLKASADGKSNIDKMTISIFDRVENTVGKGENAGHQHFLLFPQRFPKPSS